MVRPCLLVKAVLLVAVAVGVILVGPLLVFVGGCALAIWFVYGLLKADRDNQKSSHRD